MLSVKAGHQLAERIGQQHAGNFSRSEEVRPRGSIVHQVDAGVVLQMSGKDVHEMIDLVKVIAIMRNKSDGSGTSGYTSADYEKWFTTIRGVCKLMDMGLPCIGTFEDRVAKPGAKTPRNRNPAITSFLQHLSEKHATQHAELMMELESAMEKLAKDKDYGSLVDSYRRALVFSQEKVADDEDGDDVGVYTGMANVDWPLLGAYSCKKVKMSCVYAQRFMKGVAAYSMLKAMTKDTTAKLEAQWSPMGLIKTQFNKKPEKHMCPLDLTPSRLVNCAAMMFKATSDVYVLRTD